MTGLVEFPNIVAFLRTLKGYPDETVAAASVAAVGRIEALEAERDETRHELEWPWVFPPIEMATASVLAIRAWNNDGPEDERLGEEVEALRLNLGHIRREVKAAEAESLRLAGELEEARKALRDFDNRIGVLLAQSEKRMADSAEYQISEHLRREAHARAQAAEAQLALCREALEPFVRAYRIAVEHFGDGTLTRQTVTSWLAINDYRNASAALSKLEEGSTASPKPDRLSPSEGAR